MTVPTSMREYVSVAAVGLVFGIGAWYGRTSEASAQYITRTEYAADLAKARERQVADSIDRATVRRVLVKLSCKILHDCDP